MSQPEALGDSLQYEQNYTYTGPGLEPGSENGEDHLPTDFVAPERWQLRQPHLIEAPLDIDEDDLFKSIQNEREDCSRSGNAV